MSDQSPWLTVGGAASRALLSAATILRAARRGELRGYKVSGRRCWRFRSADVDAWLMTSTTPTLVTPGQERRA